VAKPLIEICVARARATSTSTSLSAALKATPKGMRVCEFIVLWTIAERELGHEPSFTEFSKWWRHTEKESRTAWNRLAEFKELFPEYDSPHALAKQLLRRSDAKLSRDDGAALMSRPLTLA
jgi:hypothetical protein